MATMVQQSSVSFETVHEQMMSPVKGENTFDLWTCQRQDVTLHKEKYNEKQIF